MHQFSVKTTGERIRVNGEPYPAMYDPDTRTYTASTVGDPDLLIRAAFFAGVRAAAESDQLAAVLPRWAAENRLP